MTYKSRPYVDSSRVPTTPIAYLATSSLLLMAAQRSMVMSSWSPRERSADICVDGNDNRSLYPLRNRAG